MDRERLRDRDIEKEMDRRGERERLRKRGSVNERDCVCVSK